MEPDSSPATTGRCEICITEGSLGIEHVQSLRTNPC